MLKKTIEYEDYDGNKRKEDFWFDIDEREITKLNLSNRGGLKGLVESIIGTQDNKRLVELFEEIIQLAYGVKSPDGRKFIKNKEVLDDFIQTRAYTKLYMELVSNADAASDFINGVVPKRDDVIVDTNNVITLPSN